MKECCTNCKLMFKAHKTDFTKLKTDEPIDYELEGFICMGLGYERVATWIVGLDAETGLCEMFEPKVSEIQNSSEKPNNCETEPQTDYRITGTIGYRCPKCGRGNFLSEESNCVYCGEPLIKDTPQTDCAWK